MMAKSRLWLGVALLVGLALAVQWTVSWAKLLTPWRTIPLHWLLLAALLTFGSYVARALRLYDYFLPTTDGGFTACLKLTLLHNLLNNLLPLRTGEASFPMLMRRYFSTPLTTSVAALIWFRFMDLHALAVVALAALGSQWLGNGIASLLTIAWLSLPWWLFRWQPLVALERVAARLPPPWQNRLINARQGLPQTPAAFWRAWLWTQLNWLVKLAVFAWVLQLFAPLSLTAAFMGAMGGDLTSVLPVHGLAGAGTYEAGVVAALAPFGVTASNGLAAAVNLHLFMLGLSVVGAGLAVLLRYQPATRERWVQHG